MTQDVGKQRGSDGVSTETRVLFIQHQDDCPPGYVGERLEERGARVEVVHAQPESLPDPREFSLLIPLGSDDSAYDDSLPYVRREAEWLSSAVEAQVPVFGICFGAQLLSRVLGGKVGPVPGGPEIGWLSVETTEASLVGPGPWLVWHLDVMTTPPDGVEIARTAVGTQAFTHGPHIGVQFHPEATMDSVRIWAQRYRDSVRRVGLDHDELLAETADLYDHARRQAHTLTDRVVEWASTKLSP